MSSASNVPNKTWQWRYTTTTCHRHGLNNRVQTLANTLAELGIGARSLHRLIGATVDSVDHRWPELAESGVIKVTVTAACLQERTEPLLDYGNHTDRQDLNLRQQALKVLPRKPRIANTETQQATEPSVFTDTRDWSMERIREHIDSLKEETLDLLNGSEGAVKWWDEFEQENSQRPSLIVRLLEELARRKATLNEFYLACNYSNTENVQASLHYLDYLRLKKRDES